jgi:hypothetical protein
MEGRRGLWTSLPSYLPYLTKKQSVPNRTAGCLKGTPGFWCSSLVYGDLVGLKLQNLRMLVLDGGYVSIVRRGIWMIGPRLGSFEDISL